MADLIVKDVALRLGDNEILKGVSLAVPAGEVVALLGPSGSGKTTLLRASPAWRRHTRGSIAIGDNVFFDAAREHRIAGRDSAASAWCSSPTRCGRTAPCSTTSPMASSCATSGRRDQDAGREDAGADRAWPSRRALPASAFRRPAAARRHCARAGLRAAGHPARRAAVQPRRQAARGSARLAAHADRHARICPPSTSPTTRSRRWRSPTGSCCSTPASSSRKARRPRSTTTPRRYSPRSSWAATTGSMASWSITPAGARPSKCSASA